MLSGCQFFIYLYKQHFAVRLVNQAVDDFVCIATEFILHFCSYVNDKFQYSLSYCHLQGIFPCPPKEFADGFVVGKPFRDGQDVVLETCDGDMRNLRSEMPGLALVHSEQRLLFFEEIM